MSTEKKTRGRGIVLTLVFLIGTGLVALSPATEVGVATPALRSKSPVAGPVLTFVEAKRNGLDGVEGLRRAWALAVSPDARHIYVAGSGEQAVAAFNVLSR